MKTNTILYLSIVILLMSCHSSKEKDSYIVSNDVYDAANKIKSEQDEEGYNLMKANCYACHNPNTASHDEILTPPFKAVKMHYLKAYEDKEKFVNAMVNWVQNPDKEKALMFGAVKRFEVMPKLALPTKDLEKIASYIYDHDVDQPEWMNEHIEEMNKKKGTLNPTKN